MHLARKVPVPDLIAHNRSTRLPTLQFATLDPGHNQNPLAAGAGRFESRARPRPRVHVIVEPLTDYLRYEFAAYRQNSAAGEDVRLISTTGADWPVGLPQGVDYWLFDNREVWDMDYNPGGRFVRAVRSSSTEHVEQCQQWRDVALSRAVSLADYLRVLAA